MAERFPVQQAWLSVSLDKRGGSRVTALCGTGMNMHERGETERQSRRKGAKEKQI